MSQDQSLNKVKSFLDCRYISACEACWQIFKFDIHFRTPTVQRLWFYLDEEQNITFSDTSSLPNVVVNEDVRKTMFIEWFKMNKRDPRARKLLYTKFP
jgi:hypothetical protein